MDLLTLALIGLGAIVVYVVATHKPKAVTMPAPKAEDAKVAAVNSIPTVTEIAATAEIVSKPAKKPAAQKPSVKAKVAVQAKKTAAKKPAAIKAPAKKVPAKKPAARAKKV